ncbi:hypothetical protein IWZ01DRAFT_86813 [Phyllosticta capitalensis]
MARPVHTLSYQSIFISRNCSRRRIFTRRLSTAAQAVDDTVPPAPPLRSSVYLLELNRHIIRKSIGAEQLVPVRNAILKPFSNPFAQPPLNYKSLWYRPRSYEDLVESHVRVLAAYESRTGFLRASSKRHLYFVKAILTERALPPDCKYLAVDRVASSLSHQARRKLQRPRRRRSRAELLHRNERLLILLNAICAEAEKVDKMPLPQSLIKLGLETAVECRNFQACMLYLKRLGSHNCPIGTKTLKRVLSRLSEPESAFDKLLATRPFRTWTSNHSAMLLVGPENAETHSPKMSPSLERKDPECFRLWLQTLATLSQQSPKFKARLPQQLRREWDYWQKSLRRSYTRLPSSSRGCPYASWSVMGRSRRAASDFDMLFLESFVRAGAYSDAWTVLFSTKIPFTALSTTTRRALIENPEFTPPASWTPENEKQVLSIYAEYCRAIEGALGVQWVRDEKTGESFHRISTGYQRPPGRLRRRVRRAGSRRSKT